jgi:hypothetical protein
VVFQNTDRRSTAAPSGCSATAGGQSSVRADAPGGLARRVDGLLAGAEAIGLIQLAGQQGRTAPLLRDDQPLRSAVGLRQKPQ